MPKFTKREPTALPPSEIPIPSKPEFAENIVHNKTIRITLIRPEEESQSKELARKVAVNGQHYMIMYGKPTDVPLCVYHALNDARTIGPVTIDEGAGVTAPRFTEVPRFTIIVH